MADDYREYLAARVLSENKPVTYRLLSRALTVNVNIAKQMLYDFHTKENTKTPNSVHATYLLAGRKRSLEHTNGANGQDGDDTIMQSSPYMSSMPEPEAEQPSGASIPKTSIILVREEELDSVKAEFEEITSIHMYSLEPGPVENLNVLSVCNQEVATTYSNADQDPLERWRLYGSVHNPYIKRRTAKFAPAPAPAPPKAAPAKAAPKVAAKANSTGTPKEEKTPTWATKGSASEGATSGRSTPQPATASTVKSSDSKPTLKREKSDIFKSFAKAKAKPKETATPVSAEDAPMQGMSEDEGDDDEPPEVKIDEEKAQQLRKARAEREEKLRQMMEESDEEMPDVTPAEEKDSQATTQEEPTSTTPVESSTTTTQAGRRRGRRKVIKKKKVKDEDGYLVTKEETVWESFSEDEPQPKKPKPAPKPSSTAKGKTGKFGQGSIANFFKKA